MEMLQLKYFQTVARLEHMTKAAEQLQIAQPSLSKTIARLEETVGVPLFDRQGRQIRLNQFGRTFLERVDRAFRELEEGGREIRDMAGLHRGSVKLGVSITSVLPELIGAFVKQYPQVHFRQTLGTTSAMKRQLEEGEIDLCISSIPIISPELEWKELMTEEIFIAVSPEHALADRESIHLHELGQESFISMNVGFAFRDLTDQLCSQTGFKPAITFEVDEPEGIVRLVGQGLGIAFLPALGLKARARHHLKRIRILNPNFYRTTGLAWSKKHYLSLAAQKFSEYLISGYERMQDELSNG
ncbi:LysR family transcriptional regulator [Cohnella cholangitidis]|uniref:LysR family transcriptional regulator n=1 Tax=Cohnella cholangitidis TaxID=2598458 RepID=A0A7G5BY68_9BACL|nr:LysR substrate-binding domain-containing protein [Cohnella cholangitidis]QMV41902.1 LysR family transcriptional regulator [Cohnella cholangitidis]